MFEQSVQILRSTIHELVKVFGILKGFRGTCLKTMIDEGIPFLLSLLAHALPWFLENTRNSPNTILLDIVDLNISTQISFKCLKNS